MKKMYWSSVHSSLARKSKECVHTGWQVLTRGEGGLYVSNIDPREEVGLSAGVYEGGRGLTGEEIRYQL